MMGAIARVGARRTAATVTGIIPRLPGQPRGRPIDDADGTHRHGRHARAQAHDVRRVRRLCRAARWHRHARGTGRAVDPGRSFGRHDKPIVLADIQGFWKPLFALLTHMRETEFIRPGLSIDILKAERVEDILPRLQAAAAGIPKADAQMAPEIATRL